MTDQPPIYSAGKGSPFFSNTCVCHHIPDRVILIIISISQLCSCLPSGLFLSHSRPFKNRTSDTGWVQGWVVGSGIALQGSKSPVQFLMGSFGFFIDLILPGALRSRLDSERNRNEYQGYLLRVKAVCAYG